MSVLNQKVLQLNKAYEPLGVIDMVRAISLVFRHRAFMEQVDETRLLRTQHATFKVPSVIVLTEYHDLRRKRRASKKHAFHIFVRDKFRCQYCGKKLPAFELTLDHILPQSREGPDDSDNLATSCRPCNQRKSNRTPDEARMPLLATPSALRYGLDRVFLYHFVEERPEWRPYLFLDEAVA